MAPIMLFAFGPAESFFFFCSTTCMSHRTNYAFESTVIPRLAIPYSVTLGPGETEYAAPYLAKNPSSLRRSLNYSEKTPLYPMQQFLLSPGSQDPLLVNTKVTVGPDNTYLALKGSEISHSPEECLPPNLVAALRRKELQPIKEASLGYGGAWWLQYADGTCDWDFAGCYHELNELLSTSKLDPGTILHLALSRYSPKHYFLLYDGHKVRFLMPALFSNLITPMFRNYQKLCSSVSGVLNGGSGSDEPPAYENVNHGEEQKGGRFEARSD